MSIRYLQILYNRSLPLRRTILIAFLLEINYTNAVGQWSSPVLLSPSAVNAGLNESMGSCIGVSGDTIHVVWFDITSSTTSVIYYIRSTDSGRTWNNPVPITSVAGNAWNPAIAVVGSNVHVVWREINPSNNHRASYYQHSLDGGSTWTSKVFLDSTADWPAISISGNIVYVVNDVVTSQSPYNTEIFFLRSLDNGVTWSGPQQLTFATGRSEDESIHAEGSYIHMSWNDNRTNQFQIFYKESADYGVTWGPDIVVDLPFDYNTMVWSNGTKVDVVAAGAPSGRYQLLLSQSSDRGTTWGVTGTNLSADTANTYFLPDMVRDGNDLHIVCNSSAGAKYFHSSNGGLNWDPVTVVSGANFIAYSGCVLHIIYNNNGKIYYLRNPTGNRGPTCSVYTGISSPPENSFQLKIFPNPFSIRTFVQVKKRLQNASLTLKNMLGQTVKEINNISGYTITLERGNLASGLYLLQLNEDNREIAADKILITE